MDRDVEVEATRTTEVEAVTTALEQIREDQALGAAYRRARAALPDGWHIRFQDGTFTENRTGPSTAEAWAPMADDFEQEFGDTATQALEALADALEARTAE